MPVIATGVGSYTVPGEVLPTAAYLLSPQHQTVPTALNAHTAVAPTATWTAEKEFRCEPPNGVLFTVTGTADDDGPDAPTPSWP